MAQIDHCESNKMRSKKIGFTSVEPYQQSPEFINPSEGAFTGKSALIDFCIEKPFASSFRSFSIALVLVNVWDQPMIETSFSRIFGVKSLVRIEIGTNYYKTKLLDEYEGLL